MILSNNYEKYSFIQDYINKGIELLREYKGYKEVEFKEFYINDNEIIIFYNTIYKEEIKEIKFVINKDYIKGDVI